MFEPRMKRFARPERTVRITAGTILAAGITLVLFAAPQDAVAAELRVPTQFATIQSAIVAASPGDVVRVDPGTYVEPLDFIGKAIVVESVQGPASTVLTWTGAVVTFQNQEGPGSVLRGFAIRDGLGASFGPPGTTAGGGAFCFASSPTIEGNVFESNEASLGGAIACIGAAPTVRGNRFLSNAAREGGALYCDMSSPLIESNEFIGNTAFFLGGAIACTLESSPSIRGNRIELGSSLGLGGGIGAREGSAPIIIENEIRDNTSNSQGGGIYIEGVAIDDRVRILDNHILGNESFTSGGGIQLRNAPAEIIGNRIRLNRCTTSGGGLGVVNEGIDRPLDSRGNHFDENRAADGGGASCRGTLLESTNDRFRANVAESEGGGLWLGVGTAILRNPIIHENSADELGGGIHSTLDLTIVNGTIAFNTAVSPPPSAGGGLWLSSPMTTIVNSILWANEAEDGRQIKRGGPIFAEYSIIEGLWPGFVILDVDPRFVDAASGDFRLRFDSPAIDRGTLGSPLLPTTDFEGDPRHVEGDGVPPTGIDMGADELRRDVAASFGTVGAAGESLENVLFVNGSAGDASRIIRVATRDQITIDMAAPSAGPEPAPFALYLWTSPPDPTTVVLQPRGLGLMTHSTPLDGSGPQPARIWNNIGFATSLGVPQRPSTAAPSRIVDLARGPSFELTVTLQGILRDDGSAGAVPYSLTNAVVVEIRTPQ